MKKSATRERSVPAKKKGKISQPAKGYWHFDHVVAKATEAKMNRIWDAFIEAVEKEGLYCTGTFHASGGCGKCKGITDE